MWRLFYSDMTPYSSKYDNLPVKDQRKQILELMLSQP